VEIGGSNIPGADAVVGKLNLEKLGVVVTKL